MIFFGSICIESVLGWETMKKLIVLFALFTTGSYQTHTTRVTLWSTIHGAHKSNSNYSYDDLFSFIEMYNPDLIGVEIRKEDMDSSARYLERFYPFEMRECIRRYPSKTVVGFDWLGSSIEGRPIPENYFKELEVKRLEKRLNNDSTLAVKLAVLDSLAGLKTEIALHASMTELNGGRYDSLNAMYYEKMAAVLQDTPYRALPEFYHRRDENISDNIIRIIEGNPGKKMLFLMGADHRSHAVARVTQRFGKGILSPD